jgi:YidC/Oxa1 family membrane protein insertase
MDRQGKIAVAIAIAVLLGWMVYEQKHPPQPAPDQASPTPAAQASVSGTDATATPATTAGAVATPAPAVEENVPEQTQNFQTPSVDYTFTNIGGGIARATLLQHIAEDGNHVVLNDFDTVPVGALTEEPGGAGFACTITHTITSGTTAVVCERTTPQQIQITKKYTLPAGGTGADQHTVTLDVTFTNKSGKPYKSPGYYISLGSSAPIHITDMPYYTGFDWSKNGKDTQIGVMWFGSSSLPIIGHPERTSYNIASDAADIDWGATYSQYFTNILTPVGTKASSVWARRFPLDLTTRIADKEWLQKNPNVTPKWYAIEAALGMPAFELKPDQAVTQQFRIYLGPRKYQFLKTLNAGEVSVMHFGWFGFVSTYLLRAMNGLAKIFGGGDARGGYAYAFAIIALTLILKGLLWPLQNRATKSMKKMQALTPKMNELRDKYKDDPARMNQETMKLYKDYGINPLAGCLPMVIQLPIFIGFYRMLGTAIELRNSKFLWVQDLSRPDTIFHIASIPINPLPLLMGASNLWMMSVTPKSGDAAQQRMMIFMPLIFLYICYNYASGLALYMMVGNLFSIVQLYVTKTQTAAPPVLKKIKR